MTHAPHLCCGSHSGQQVALVATPAKLSLTEGGLNTMVCEL